MTPRRPDRYTDDGQFFCALWLSAKWIAILTILGFLAVRAWPQEGRQHSVSTSTTIAQPNRSPIGIDIFLMPGLDVVRPGSGLRSNLNVGAGWSMHSISPRWPLGNELTVGYTYENAGTHGFWHGNQAAHTISVGDMRNYRLTARWSIYTWSQLGVTTITGGTTQNGDGGVQNRFYSGESIGAAIAVGPHQSIWLQETFNKIATVPWYTSSNVGYVISF